MLLGPNGCWLRAREQLNVAGTFKSARGSKAKAQPREVHGEVVKAEAMAEQDDGDGCETAEGSTSQSEFRVDSLYGSPEPTLARGKGEAVGSLKNAAERLETGRGWEMNFARYARQREGRQRRDDLREKADRLPGLLTWSRRGKVRS